MIDQLRLGRFLAEAHLKQGAGKGANGTIDVCIVQATDWLTGGKGVTDSPSCVDPTLRRFAISLNDSNRFAKWRDELKPFAVKLANTNHGDALTFKRAFMCADWALRELAPTAMDAIAEIAPANHAEKIKQWAATYRTIPPITDRATAIAGRDIGRGIEREARDAAYAAYATSAASDAYVAYAKGATYAAYAAGGAAAASAASAANAACAAYAVAAADAADEASAAYAAAAAYAAGEASAVAAADAADEASAAYAAGGANAASARAKAKAFTRRFWEMSLAQLDALCEARL